MSQDEKLENQTSVAASPEGSKTAAVAKPSRSRFADKIRSELNIEKWPAIWQPSKSKNKPALRVMERELTTDDGTRIVSRVEVGYTQLGTLTTEEQKLLYVLIKLWEDEGKPDVQVFFSTRGLARMLRKKGWGTNVIEATTKSLRKLRTIPIEWINSYFDQTKAGAVIVDRRPFTILGDLRVVERRQDGAVNSSKGYFKFDDHILRNLQLNYTKPVCIEEFFKLKSEIAQLVYSHVDLMLFDKNRYERRSRELFDDLGLRNDEYNHMYERRRALEKAVKELEGIRLSKGVLKSATIMKTVDGKDYKVQFTKIAPFREEGLSEETLDRIAAPPTVVINHYSNEKDGLRLEAEDLVRYFHKLFHDVDTHAPLSKETEQALVLITQHGAPTAKQIVDFAHNEAAKTNYAVQHFGAVLSYASRALTQIRRPRREARQATVPSQTPEAGRGVFERGERRLAMLSAEDYERRFEKAKADLFREQPFLARVRTKGNSLVTRTIRARMARALDSESTDLIPFDPGLAARYPWLFFLTQNLPR